CLFFSSRRRNTRFSRDWSSDVCSSDLAAKFNIYPNPATNVVNMTNNENRLVNQVAVYDVTGKLISTQNFNEQAELQLNVENLARSEERRVGKEGRSRRSLTKSRQNNKT